MKLEFTKEKILKRYRVEYKEGYVLHQNPKVSMEDYLDFDVEYDKNKITLMTKLKETKEISDYEKILESTNKAFDRVEYILNEKGIPVDIGNFYEIREKWDKIRKSVKPSDSDEILSNLIFRLSGIIDSDDALFDSLKQYGIIPYLFTGFHNAEIGTNRDYTAYGVIYNVFPLEDIPVVYKLNSEVVDTKDSWDRKREDEEGNKKLLIKGKQNPKYDGFKYSSKVKERLADGEADKLKQRMGTLDVEVDGYYIFGADETLKEMELTVKIGITNLLNYACRYTVSERKEDKLEEARDSNLQKEVEQNEQI